VFGDYRGEWVLQRYVGVIGFISALLLAIVAFRCSGVVGVVQLAFGVGPGLCGVGDVGLCGVGDVGLCGVGDVGLCDGVVGLWDRIVEVRGGVVGLCGGIVGVLCIVGLFDWFSCTEGTFQVTIPVQRLANFLFWWVCQSIVVGHFPRMRQAFFKSITPAATKFNPTLDFRVVFVINFWTLGFALTSDYTFFATT